MPFALKLRRNSATPRPSLRERYAALKGSAAKVIRRPPAGIVRPKPIGGGEPSKALAALIDAHQLAYGRYLIARSDWSPDLNDLRQAEEEAFRALLHSPLRSDADRAAYAVAVIERQSGALGDHVATGRDHPLSVAYRSLRFGEHAREPEQMRDIGRSAEPEASPDAFLATLTAFRSAQAAYDAISDEIEKSGMTPERQARERALSDAEGVVGRAIWQTVPTTPAGHRALLEYARHEIQERTTDEGDIEDAEELCGMVLSAFAVLIEAGPPAGTPSSVQADPHVALMPVLRQAWDWDRACRPILEYARDDSSEGQACRAVTVHCWDTASRIVDLPAPKTLAGFGVLALAMSVWAEGAIGMPENDGHDDERYPDEKRFASAVRAMMSVAGVSPLPGWTGFEFSADSQTLWAAMLKEQGEGSLPAWALAGKTGPDAASEA